MLAPSSSKVREIACAASLRVHRVGVVESSGDNPVAHDESQKNGCVLSSSTYPSAQLSASHVMKYPGGGQSSSQAVIRQSVQLSGQLVQEFVREL